MAQQGQGQGAPQPAGNAAPVAAGGQALPAPPAPPAVVFALAPALVDNNPINYQDPQGIKLFKAAVQELSVTFDGEPKNLRIFLAKVHERAIMSNWVETLTVADNNFQDHYFPTEYGQVSLKNVQAHA